MDADLDTPNFRPGYCPDCGQRTLWDAMLNQWECSYCDWRGRQPAASDYRDHLKENMEWMNSAINR